MSMPHELNPANGLLNQVLKQDTSGEALRELIDQLATSGKQVEVSLDQPHTAAEQDVLQQLAEAIRLGDTALQRLWVKTHKRPVVL
jgi:molybdopterin converting factor small subunit